MTEIITDEELSSYLELELTPKLMLIARKANELISEAWLARVEPVPSDVWALTMRVAARAAANTKGLTSWTRSWDDVQRTERMEGGHEKFGLYLTDDERKELNGEAPPKKKASGASTISVRPRSTSC